MISYQFYQLQQDRFISIYYMSLKPMQLSEVPLQQTEHQKRLNSNKWNGVKQLMQLI